METKNYLIRESQFDDYKYFAEWEVDPFVTQYLSYDEDRTYEDVVEEAYANRADDTKIDYTIVDKMTGEPIGRVFLSRIDRLDYYTGNVRASSLYEKMGFKPEGVARNSTKKDGKYYDLNLMSMLKSEYLARYSAKKG